MRRRRRRREGEREKKRREWGEKIKKEREESWEKKKKKEEKNIIKMSFFKKINFHFIQFINTHIAISNPHFQFHLQKTNIVLKVWNNIVLLFKKKYLLFHSIYQVIFFPFPILIFFLFYYQFSHSSTFADIYVSVLWCVITCSLIFITSLDFYVFPSSFPFFILFYFIIIISHIHHQLQATNLVLKSCDHFDLEHNTSITDTQFERMYFFF